MSKEITPMKRLSVGLNFFKNNIDLYFKEVNLNKSAPKYNPYPDQGIDSTSKGVENDFITIFKSKYHEHLSFAISYTYIDKPLEEQIVEVSIKQGKDNKKIRNSFPLSLEDFRLKLNKINAQFKDEKITTEVILDKVSSIFLDKELDFQKEFSKNAKNLQSFIQAESEKLNINQLEDQKKSLENQYNAAKKQVAEEYAKLPETKLVEQLKAKLARAEKLQRAQYAKLNKKHNVDGINVEKSNCERLLYQNKYNLDKSIEEQISQLPHPISRKLKMK